MLMLTYNPTPPAPREPWNKGKLVGPKPPFKLQEIWAIRIRLDIVSWFSVNRKTPVHAEPGYNHVW